MMAWWIFPVAPGRAGGGGMRNGNFDSSLIRRPIDCDGSAVKFFNRPLDDAQATHRP